MSRTHGGKGSKQRPLDEKNKTQFADNWDRIFNRSAVDDAADVMSGNDPVIEDPDPAAIFNRDHHSLITGNLQMDGTNFELAGDFMNSFGQEVLDVPTLPEQNLAKLRLELIREEVEELNVGIEGMDIVEIADALTDILYVVYGAGHAFGIDLDECYQEVHRSNMSKLGADGKPIYREDGKILKGPDYFHPNLKDILDGAL